MLVSAPQNALSITTARWIIVSLCVLFLSFASLARAQESVGLLWSILGWGSALIIALLALNRWRPAVSFSVAIRRPHYVQLLVQCGVFAYWGWHWETVYLEMPLILSQVVFAYLAELVVCWWRRGEWRVGFGPWPIVFSTNLFMWFHDDYFAVQYLMVALAYLSRELLRWERDGRSVHIFNPSAFGLCVISLVLIVFELPHLTWGAEISVALGRPLYAYEFIFLMGVIVQLFFRVTLVTMSAVAASWIVGTIYFGSTDGYMYIDTTIPIAVFLGMNLLVTDPASSPQSNGGKVLFGILYGVAIFCMYDVLRDMGRPAVGDDPGLSVSWMDKLLFLPFLNLLARPLDRIGRYLSIPNWSWSATKTNGLHVGIWVVVFLVVRPGLIDHPGRHVDFWESRCDVGMTRGCENVAILLQGGCAKDDPAACYYLGLRFEHGEGVPLDLKRAGGAYKRACELENGGGCRALGVLFTHGKGVDKNAQAAVDLYETGCSFGDRDACVFAAEALGRGMGLQSSPKRAAGLAKRACDAKSPRGCFLLGQALRTGRGVPVDLTAALSAYQRACEGKSYGACALYGTMTWAGHGVSADRDEGLKILTAACLHHPDACRQLKRIQASTRDGAQSREP
jgi:TPR repeat protein